jgi:hypothetical protein
MAVLMLVLNAVVLVVSSVCDCSSVVYIFKLEMK